MQDSILIAAVRRLCAAMERQSSAGEPDLVIQINPDSKTPVVFEMGRASAHFTITILPLIESLIDGLAALPGARRTSPKVDLIIESLPDSMTEDFFSNSVEWFISTKAAPKMFRKLEEKCREYDNFAPLITIISFGK